LKAAGIEPSTAALKAVSAPIADLEDGLATLKAALSDDSGESALDEAKHAQDALLPAMEAVRTAADTLESLVADDLWPLPTYQEMLYVL
jgi:glutamine synthetase